MTSCKRVLLVEDEPAVSVFVGRVLRVAGYQVDAAGSGAEALTLARMNPPDLMVVDLSLPDTTGQELVDTLRDVRVPDVPAVFVSGHSREDAVQAGLLAEGEAFLSKPFTPAELRRAVSQALDATG